MKVLRSVWKRLVSPQKTIECINVNVLKTQWRYNSYKWTYTTCINVPNLHLWYNSSMNTVSIFVLLKKLVYRNALSCRDLVFIQRE